MAIILHETIYKTPLPLDIIYHMIVSCDWQQLDNKVCERFEHEKVVCPLRFRSEYLYQLL